MLSRPLIPILFSLAGGVVLGHIGLSAYLSLFIFLPIPITLILLLSPFISHRLKSLIFIILFFLLGVFFDLNSHHESRLAPLAGKREKVIIEGTVLRPAKMMKNLERLDVRTHRIFFNGQVRRVSEKIRVTVFKHPRDLPPGELIRFPARLKPFKNFNNPGRYDYELAMSLMQISCAASVSDGRYIVPMGKGDLGFPMALLEGFRSPVRDFFRENLTPQNDSLFRAFLLGEKQGIAPELREQFQAAGLGHILAVSGLHIGLVAWLVFFLSNKALSISYGLILKADIRKTAALVTCVPVIFYTCLTGFQVSSQRAMVMALTYLFSIILEREKEVWSTLALAALIVLAIDPHALFSISFQLSFGAVLGILWLAPVVFNKIPTLSNEGKKHKNITKQVYIYLTGLISVTLSAVIFLLPIIAYYFHRISLVSVFANLMVVPILGLWVLPLGLSTVLCLPFSSSLAHLPLQLSTWGLEGMIGLIRFWSHLPGASFWVITPNIFEILLYYGLLFSLFSIRHRPWARIGLLLVLTLFVFDIFYWTYKTGWNRDLKVTYLDVGQGNAALIQFPGHERMLIDGGGFSTNHFDVGRMVIAPFLWRSKICRVDYLVLTHPQSDHMNGLRFIAAHFHPSEFWFNGDRVKTGSFMELMEIIEERPIKIYRASDLIGGREISGVKIQILHPASDGMGLKFKSRGAELNNNSLVLRFSYRGRSLLFPGDLERPGEKTVVLNAGPLLQSDILLAPHHGSKTSCSSLFLRSVRPKICIISSGSGNHQGFPHWITLKRLEEIGCDTIRIDQVGAVQLSLGEKEMKVSSFLN